MADTDTRRNKNFNIGFMKLNCCLMLGVLVAMSAAAQNSTNSLPTIPPPAVGASAAMVIPPPSLATPPVVEKKVAAPAKKAVVKKKKIVAKPVAPKKIVFSEAHATLTAGPAEVVVNHINVRGQAGLQGEVITHVQKGDLVNVISQITLDKHKADEPAQWAKISLPTNVTVWVNTKFIDAATKTVTPKKLNLRGGPGENYSVLGVLEKGTAVVEAGTKGDWTKLEAPANSYAFIAAMYLKQEASGNVPNNPPPSTETSIPATPTTVADTAPIVAVAPTSIPAGSELAVAPPVLQPQVIIQTNIIIVTDTNVPPPPPRIVTHEGSVRRSVSVVAPTYFELYDPSNDRAINYLFSNTTNLSLVRYNGLHISVTGEEGLDARWQATPVLTVQKIYVLSGNVPASAPKPAPAAKDAKAEKHWYYLWLN